MSLSRAVTMRIGSVDAARSSLHDEVRRSALQVLDHAIAAMLDDDAKAVALQIRAHELGKTQIVFDEQDERRGIHCSDCHQKMFQGGRRL